MGIYCSIAAFNGFAPREAINIAAIIVLLFISAMVSGSETSFFSLTPIQLEKIRNGKTKSRKAIAKLLGMQDYLLATVLIVNNLVNICIVILCNNSIDHLVTFSSAAWEFVFKTVVVTFLLLLFGEIMPKIFANYNPLKFASRVSVPLLALKTIFKPFSYLLVRYSSLIRNRHNRRAKENISIDELSNALEMTVEDQSRQEKKMLSGIVSFVNTDVEDIMHQRPDITAVNIDWDYDEVKNVFIKSGFSRLPVYRESIDKIEGVLYVKDMLPFISMGKEFEWHKHLREAYYIPEHKKINDLLEEFQNNKVHMAIVVDEYGSTLGLVSMEDILEEIVGEISDESDVEEKRFRKVDERTFIFEAKTNIYELEKILGLDEGVLDGVKGDAETIAGLMLEVKKEFLKTGDTITVEGLKFTVVSICGRKVEKIKVEKVSK